MTLLVGFPSATTTTRALELAATLRASAGTGSRVVDRACPRRGRTPARRVRPRVRGLVDAGTAARPSAEAEALLAEHCPDVTRVPARSRRRSVAAGTRPARPSGSGDLLIVLGLGHGRSPWPRASRLDRGPPAALLDRSRWPLATRGYRAQPTTARSSASTCAFRGDGPSRPHARADRRDLPRGRCRACGSRRSGSAAETMYPPEVAPTVPRTTSRRPGSEQAKASAAGRRRRARSTRARCPSRRRRRCAVGRDLGRTRSTTSPGSATRSSSSARRRASLMSRLFLGSNGAKILRHSPVPVVVVP